jgi:cytochrome c-type biogenesis protein CcmH
MIWIAIGLMALATIAALLWPILKAPAATMSRAAYDMTVFQDQLKEVDRDLERGVLTADEADAARLEIQRRILSASKAPMETTTSETEPKTSRGRIGIAAVVAVLVPLLAVGIYIEVGAPGLTKPEALKAEANGEGQTAEHGGPSDEQINKMVEQLAQKVAQNPNDAEGVTLLARTYRQLGRFADAVKQYNHLVLLKPEADTFSSLGEVIVAAADGQVSKEAHDALLKALSLDRTEPRARFYLGLEQAEKGQPKNAIAIWRDLSASAPQDAPWLGMVKEQMAGVAQEAGIPPMTVDPKHPLDFVPAEEMALAKMQAAAPPLAGATPPAGAPMAGMPPGMPGGGPNMSALQGSMSPDQIKMVEGMVKGLAEKLEKNPDDYKGWMMLGRSYTVLKNYEGAKKAYEKAVSLKPAEVEPKLQYMAFIMTTVDPDAIAPLPKQLGDTAADILKINPDQAEALYVTGLLRAKAGDKAGAKEFWAKAQAAMPEGAPLKGDIARRIKALD